MKEIKDIKDCIRKTRLYIEYGIFREKRKGYPLDVESIRKMNVLKEYKIKYSSQTLIETGTYLGNMIELVHSEFEGIYSIELSKWLAKNARKRFAEYPHIHILEGDSSKILPQILSKINEPCLFWLDAHFSGGITTKGQKYTPIMSELTQILTHPIKNHVILIDDARLFGTKPDYPSISEIETIINAYPNLSFEVADDIIRICPRTIVNHNSVIEGTY